MAEQITQTIKGRTKRKEIKILVLEYLLTFIDSFSWIPAIFPLEGSFTLVSLSFFNSPSLNRLSLLISKVIYN
jgi:hypothetical protein